jgi:hypothetical protein
LQRAQMKPRSSSLMVKRLLTTRSRRFRNESPHFEDFFMDIYLCRQVKSILNGSHAANAKKQNIMGKVREIRVRLDHRFRSLAKAFINFRMELPITFRANIKTTHRSILTEANTSSAKSTSLRSVAINSSSAVKRSASHPTKHTATDLHHPRSSSNVRSMTTTRNLFIGS